MRKLCVDCVYNKYNLWCQSPNNCVSLVDGKSNLRFCSISRKYDSECGVAGKWFEAKEVAKITSWHGRIFKIFRGK